MRLAMTTMSPPMRLARFFWKMPRYWTSTRLITRALPLVAVRPARPGPVADCRPADPAAAAPQQGTAAHVEPGWQIGWMVGPMPRCYRARRVLSSRGLAAIVNHSFTNRKFVFVQYRY